MKAVEKSVIETATETASNVATEISNTAREAGRLGKAATQYADQTVHDHPWRAVGIAAGVGFLLGLLVRR